MLKKENKGYDKKIYHKNKKVRAKNFKFYKNKSRKKKNENIVKGKKILALSVL